MYVCPSAPRSAISATPATQNEGGCHPVPRLPRETKQDVAKCHAYHAKRRWKSPSATPTTQNEGGFHQVPLLPRKMPRRHRRPSRPSAPHSAISATPATQNKGGCHQVPCLPRETKEDVAKCHACHAKQRWMSPSATPAS